MRGIIKLRQNRLAEGLAVAPVVVPLVDMARCATKKLVRACPRSLNCALSHDCCWSPG